MRFVLVMVKAQLGPHIKPDTMSRLDSESVMSTSVTVVPSRPAFEIYKYIVAF